MSVRILLGKLFLVLLFQMQTARAQPAIYQRALPELPVSALNQDLDYLKQQLQIYHPGLFLYTPRQELFAAFDSLKKAIDGPVNEVEFLKMINPVVARINCGHTGLRPSDRYHQYRNQHAGFFPFKLHFIEDRAYIHYSFNNQQKLPKGTELLHINGEPVADIQQRLYRHIFTDGQIKTSKRHELNEWFWLYYSRFIAQPLQFELAFRLPDNTETITTGTFHAVQRQAIRTGHRALRPLSYHSLNTREGQQTGLLRIRSFSREAIRKRGQKYSEFLKNSFAKIAEDGVQDLIIDLRGNEGGNDVFGSELLSYLLQERFSYYHDLQVNPATRQHIPFPHRLFVKIKKDPFNNLHFKSHRNLKLLKPQKRHNYQGRLYVLIDGGSFSAATQFAAVAHHHNRALFIGEEGGGGYYSNTSGFSFEKRLPNSGIVVTIPGMKYQNAVSGYPWHNRGLLPDFEVQQGLNDWLNGRDTQLRFVLELVTNPEVTASVHKKYLKEKRGK